MGFAFNPFTGNFDQKGSGGGASYIDGEEAVYGDLSLDAGVAPLNSAWLVRSSSGIWPFNKPGGIYIRTATAGSSRDADYTYAGTMPDVFSDAVFTLYDEASTTRTGQFNLGSITAGQNRVLTWPDGNGTIARTEDFAAPPAIGSTTPAAGSFTTLSANNGTLTASAPVLDLSQTWNNSGVTFTGLRFNATDTASAAASNLAEFQLSGTALAAIRKDGSFRVLGTGDRTLLAHPNFALSASAGGAWLGVNTTISLSSAGNFVTAGGLIRLNDVTSANPVELNRDAADTLAQRRTTNPQAFRLYNITDSGLTNFERGFMRWSSSVLQIGTEKGGTGSARALEFQTDGTTRLTIAATGGNINMGTAAVFGITGLQFDSAASFRFSSAGIGSSSDLWILRGGSGIMRISTGSGDNDFNRLQFGGTANLFPALKRSSTTLQVRLADDTDFAPLACAGLTLNGDLTASTRNIVTDITTGTKIGTATDQKIGFFDKTPVVQPTAVADATDAATVITQLNALLSRMRDLGLIAT